MSELTENVKKYWPYAVGGVIGLYLLAKMGGGGNAAPARVDTTYAQLLAGQAASSAANTQAQAQLEAVRAQVNMAEADSRRQFELKATELASARELNLASLEAAKVAQYANAGVAFQNAQAAMAQSVGSSTAEIIGALNQPAVAAISANAIENSNALQAAAGIAQAEFIGSALLTNAFATQLPAVAQVGMAGLGAAFGTAGKVAQSRADTQGGILGVAGTALSMFGV